MMRAVVGPVMGVFCDLLVPQQKKSIGEIFRSFLHALLFTCIVVIVSQQVTLLGEIRAQKMEEYERAATLYSEECPYTRSSPARLKECSDLNIILNSWPMMRALSLLVKGWNSCLYMPCNEMVRHITNDLSYKIAFILIALGITSYVFNFFNCFKKKSKEWTDKYRYKETNKAALASINELLAKKDL